MFNIIESPELKVWFTSDLHLNHEGPKGATPLWESRGYNSPKHMSQCIVNAINEHVRRDDILFNLGDLCLNCSVEAFDSYLDQIVCRTVYCMMGNHSNPHYKLVYRRLVKELLGDKYHLSIEIFPLRYKNLVYINHLQEIVVNGQLIVLCHYPLYSWNHMGKNTWMLSGHEHSQVPNHLPSGKDGKILDCSWDFFKRPVSFNEIKTIMDAKAVRSVGHH